MLVKYRHNRGIQGYELRRMTTRSGIKVSTQFTYLGTWNAWQNDGYDNENDLIL